jgi:hypothetical protein
MAEVAAAAAAGGRLPKCGLSGVVLAEGDVDHVVELQLLAILLAFAAKTFLEEGSRAVLANGKGGGTVKLAFHITAEPYMTILKELNDAENLMLLAPSVHSQKSDFFRHIVVPAVKAALDTATFPSLRALAADVRHNPGSFTTTGGVARTAPRDDYIETWCAMYHGFAERLWDRAQSLDLSYYHMSAMKFVCERLSFLGANAAGTPLPLHDKGKFLDAAAFAKACGGHGAREEEAGPDKFAQLAQRAEQLRVERDKRLAAQIKEFGKGDQESLLPASVIKGWLDDTRYVLERRAPP